MVRGHTTAILLRSTEYDVYNMHGLEQELLALKPGDNVVDCRNVCYLDSTGLTALIYALKRLRKQDARSSIALMNVAPLLRRVFEITYLDRTFKLQ